MRSTVGLEQADSRFRRSVRLLAPSALYMDTFTILVYIEANWFRHEVVMQAVQLDRQSQRHSAATGLKTVFAILDKWQCSPEQIQRILQISKAAYYKYRNDPYCASLTQDQIERISYVLNIHSSLRLLFDNPQNLYGFMALPNHNPYFNGNSPLAIISSGQFAALYETFKRIDALRGGMW